MKKLTILLILALFLSGCATINSSQKYSETYPNDINLIWLNVNKIPLKNTYSYLITSKDKKLQNTPFIDGYTVHLPRAFIDYVYKYYYNNRSDIFTCLFLHEISHTEYNLASEPIGIHYQVDMKALDLLFSSIFPGDTEYKINEFYSFLKVVSNFSEAEKGVTKHLFNIVWNTVNAATYLYAGIGSFGDWFSYDINTRLGYFYNARLPKTPKFIFKRSDLSKNK